jgi:steroid 5-alpha reductase family enzyme
VYSASIPVFVFAQIGTFSPWIILGIIVILGGVCLEIFSDWQMKTFLKNRKDRTEIINVGLWKYSRHPNYLGEIIVWFGVALVLIAYAPSYWYFVFGAIINLLMFLFISIPMEEKHMLEYKPGLKDYIDRVSMLLILPNKKKRDE